MGEIVEKWAADIDGRGRIIVVYGTFHNHVGQFTLVTQNDAKFGTLLKYRPLHPQVYTNVYDTMDEAMDALAKRYQYLIEDAQLHIPRWTEKMVAVRKAQGEINGKGS